MGESVNQMMQALVVQRKEVSDLRRTRNRKGRP